jgi:hypothetical protein
MVKAYAQIAAVLFAVLGIGGFFTGDAGHVVAGQAYGNIDGVTLHLTYTRDVLNIVLALLFGYAAWRAPATSAWIPAAAAGAILLLLAIVGFVVGDDAAGSRSVANLHFPAAINVLDLVTGTLALLTVLGDLGEPAATAGSRG